MLRPLKTATYSNPQELELHIYVAGYPVQGESVLIVVAEKEKPLVVIVTDSWLPDGKKTDCISEILNTQWGNPNLDVLVWTHPHKDHCSGIVPLLAKFDPDHNTHILSTGNVTAFNRHPEFKKDATFTYNHIRENYSARHHFPAYDPNRDNSYLFLLKNSVNRNLNIDLKLEIVAPYEGLAADCMEQDLYNVNNLSLAYIFSINNMDFFMGGDISEDSVQYIDNDYFRHLNFIKIPHHGSDEIKSLTGKFTMNTSDNVHAATTVFRCGKSDNPRPDVLKQYCNAGMTVHCTGPYPKQAHTHDFGCLHYVYSLYSSTFKAVDLSGNAIKC